MSVILPSPPFYNEWRPWADALISALKRAELEALSGSDSGSSDDGGGIPIMGGLDSTASGATIPIIGGLDSTGA